MRRNWSQSLRARTRLIPSVFGAVLHNARGRHVSIRAHVSSTTKLDGTNIWIGPYSYIGPGCYMEAAHGATIRIGASVDIGPRCTLLTITHEIGPAHHRAGPGLAQGVSIGAGSWLGTNVTVLPGTRVGEGCVVGACAMLDGEYPDHSLLVGVPARVVRALE
jgi:acetyltransferase-like isoleucine patch superfamily enzyme